VKVEGGEGQDQGQDRGQVGARFRFGPPQRTWLGWALVAASAASAAAASARAAALRARPAAIALARRACAPCSAPPGRQASYSPAFSSAESSRTWLARGVGSESWLGEGSV